MSEIDFETDGVFPEEAPPAEALESVTEAIPEVTETAEPPMPPAEPPKRGHGKGLRIAAIVLGAVVVLGVVAAFAVPAIIRAVNPKAAVLSALSKTLDNAGFDDAAVLASDLQKNGFVQLFSLRLNDQYPQDLDQWGQDSFGLAPGQLSGSGFTYTLEMDRAAKKLAFNFGVDLGAYHAADIRFFADNNIFSFGSPELTGNKFYQFNTETVGADWNASPYWGSIDGVDPTLGFNLFDEVTTEKNPATTAETAALLAQFAADLNKASLMTKESNEYTLTVPADALQTYLKSTTQALEEDKEYSTIKPQGIYLPDLVNRFQGGATVLFTVEENAVTYMELILPVTGDDFPLVFRFCMTAAEDSSLSFLLEGMDSEGNAGVSVSAKVQVHTYKTDKQVGIDLPEIIITSGSESLNMSLGIGMQPLTEFSFQPEDTVSFMELDQNGVLELLLGALGGLQGISEGISAGY